ncbi:hypothetical protein AB6A40_007388 [Gnathostoma spinigerum]|uniref:SHSP domain-containing protein n=1 Tax=Gnathostoma spinigerum TaxID=75299 RepID=A0ABD6ER79_9BILA
MESTIEVQAQSWKPEQWDWPLQKNDGVVQLINTKDKFEVTLDASLFSPKEIEVKIVKNKLLIHCMHESRSDQWGEVKREISRSYQLPEDVDPKTIKSNLTSKGQLIIRADKK